MSIVASDLVAYAAQNMPEDETSTNGGGIDANIRVTFTDVASPDTIQVLSSSSSDTTQQITVVGRAASGATVQQTVQLNGTNVVNLTSLGTVERIQKATLNANCVGDVTVRRSTGPTTIGVIPAGERGFTRMFINAYSDISAKNYYMKFFWRNNHSSLALLNAQVAQSADPTGLITHLIASSVNDTATTSNRLTAPSAADTLDPDVFDDNPKTVPGNDLNAGAAIGVWLRLALAASQSPIKSTYTSQLSGQSV